MDRVIEKKKWNTKRILTIVGITAIVALIAASVYFTSGKSKLNVDTERITIGEIKTAAFHEFITLNGVVLPESTIYLDAMEGGRVEEKFVEDGTMMTKGQPILRLSNTDLELQLANQETQVFNVLTQMQISKNNAEQNSINRQNQDAEVDNALKEAERLYVLNKKLHEQKVIGLQEFQSSKNLYDYQLRRKKLTEQIMKTDATSMKQQVDQMGESYQQMKRTLALMRKKVGDLIVRAPVDGQLTSLDAEIGENKNKGQRLGQIDVMSGYKLRVDIDEHYISRVFAGLLGNCDVAGKTYQLKIK
jgi:HlyD family secretion protein